MTIGLYLFLSVLSWPPRMLVPHRLQRFFGSSGDNRTATNRRNSLVLLDARSWCPTSGLDRGIVSLSPNLRPFHGELVEKGANSILLSFVSFSIFVVLVRRVLSLSLLLVLAASRFHSVDFRQYYGERIKRM